MPQRIKKKHRPLPELIEELNTKVIVAAKELQQQLADSAERPLLLSHSAEQPVPMDTSGSSAEQPARETAQPLKALRSITDVQWWLEKNEVVLSSSAAAVRLREVVEALSTKPKPR